MSRKFTAWTIANDFARIDLRQIAMKSKIIVIIEKNWNIFRTYSVLLSIL